MHALSKLLMPAAVFGIALASCTKEPLQEHGGQTEIRLGSGIELQSKASFTQADTQIPAGEQVYVWIDRNITDLPALYGQTMTADGSGNLSGGTKMFFPMNGDHINIYSLHTNAAISADTYPAETFTHEVKAEQKTLEDYVFSDLLYSRNADVAKTTERIALTYYHQLSKIEVAVTTKDGLTGEDIAGISICGVKRLASVRPDKSSQPFLSVEPTGEVSSIAIGQDISADLTEGNAVYNDAIVVPQTLEAGTEFVNVLLQDGTSVAYRLTSPVTFESGRKYTLHMTISFTGIDITTSISDWVGGDDPIVAVSDTVRFTVHYTDGTSEETMTVDTDTIRFNGTGKTVHSIELLDHDTTYLIGRKDITGIVLNLDKEGNLGFRPAVEGYIPIGSYAEMQHINTMYTKNGRYRQEADIDLLNEPWAPIAYAGGEFQGEFDGNGYEFSNIIIDFNKTTNGVLFAGLFGQINHATLSNINLVSGFVENKRSGYIGGICAYARGSSSIIENCSNNAEINTNNSCGGIVGDFSGTRITNCINTGKITGGSYSGGIAGVLRNGAVVEFCENTGAVSTIGASSASYIYAGGIIGQGESTMKIENCRNTGDIYLINSSASQSSSNGGIAGYTSGGSINSCYNTGTLTGEGESVNYGGIAGQSGSIITACYNTGLIYPGVGSSYAGGIVGTALNSSTIACYNTGYIRASTNDVVIGGIAGDTATDSDVIITSCYWKEDAGASAAIGQENSTPTITDVFSFSDTFTPDAGACPEWGIGEGEVFGWWKNYDGNGGLPQLWWEE